MNASRFSFAVSLSILTALTLIICALLLRVEFIKPDKKIVVYANVSRLSEAGISGRMVLNLNEAPEDFELILNDSLKETVRKWVVNRFPLRVEAVPMLGGDYLITQLSNSDFVISRTQIRTSIKKFRNHTFGILGGIFMLLLFNLYQFKKHQRKF